MRIRVRLAVSFCLLAAAAASPTASPARSAGRVTSWLGRGGRVDVAAQEQQRLVGGRLGDERMDGQDGRGRDASHRGLRWTSRGFASLGDSYSAGIGTPVEGAEDACRHGLGAYPALLYGDLAAQRAPAAVRFQWLSCTGSTTADVMGSAGGATAGQVDVLDAGAAARLDFVTLSIGGNDLGFFDVINACVFRFYGLYSGTCATALERAEGLVDDDGDVDVFSQRLAVILLQLLDRVRWEKHPRFRIVVTGYARFFHADTATCDSCSMGVWRRHGREHTAGSANISDSTLLTRELRRRMNGLVAGTNRKLQAAVDAVNSRLAGPPRVLFVDYDDAFDGHRFCEPGVVEPDYDREATWFFLVGGRDGRNTTAPTADALDADSPLVDPDRCLAPALARGDWGALALCYMARARQAEPWLQPAVSPQNSMWYVPTYYGKTFHPRSAGHRAVRDALYRVWEEHGV